MPIHITIIGEDAAEVLAHVCALAKGGTTPTHDAGETPFINLSDATSSQIASLKEAIQPEETKAEKKTRKPKEEKVAEPKAEVLAPEKPKYTLQDAIDRAREIAGDGSNEKIMHALKGINTRLGISKVREIPPEKLDGYMRELNAEFPKDAVATSANMFD